MESDADRNTFLTKAQVATHYAVTTSTIDRWLKDERRAFPRPYHFGNRPKWRALDIQIYDAQFQPE